MRDREDLGGSAVPADLLAWLFSLNRTTFTQRIMTVAVGGITAAIGGSNLMARRDAGSSLPADKPVFVVGDSISAGLGIPGENAWPQMLAARRGLSVSNLARPGATLAHGTSQARAIPPGPATVLVELGGNDLLTGTTPAAFDADLRVLLAAVVTKERHVLMFELPLLPFQNAYGRIQREVCELYGVALLPRSILAGAVALPGHATDGVHLSPEGHSWLARRMSELWSKREVGS